MVAAGSAAAGLLALMFLGSGSKPAQAAVVDSPVESVVESHVEKQEEYRIVIEDNSCREDLDALALQMSALEMDVLALKLSKVNKAFVFIKPHAVTPQVCSLVKSGLEAAGIKVIEEGSISHSDIDSKKLIDNHYGAIASKAVLLNPSELSVPEKGKEEFQKMFGVSWDDAVSRGKVYNAAQACEKLGINGAEMDQKWSALKRGENLIKFGGGFYCGQIGDIYVMNGFYMSMRDKYCEAPASIHYYSVEWNPSKLVWADFRGIVLGATDPTEATGGSLRRNIYDNWESLGLKAMPDVGDNGVHASASPFEAMAERVIWLQKDLNDEAIAKYAFKSGVSEDTLRAWMKDAQVKSGDKSTSIFDLFEDLDTDEVLALLREVN